MKDTSLSHSKQFIIWNSPKYSQDEQNGILDLHSWQDLFLSSFNAKNPFLHLRHYAPKEVLLQWTHSLSISLQLKHFLSGSKKDLKFTF